ncbi:thioredoxin-like protein [Sistotremastrum niveocremeum HHB9708]|uniref:Thioredoxin n=2 Tax=Sistotremastraceae TaxID=3402574 RepID=A0A164UTQ2_9AGAM|nr:thioredoxin-like protein [Sistotremastrum niveocremeum HHB9708]KZT42694.1 thioredoxin-like protein [Sistotremastrum suecicum HHB10207 ss-3]
MSVKAINSLSEFQELVASDSYVFFDFWATWCGPCRVISPFFEQLSKDPAYSHIKFFKVDVDEQPDVAQEVGITAMPTFILFKKGAKVGQLVGARKDQLTALVKQASA